MDRDKLAKEIERLQDALANLGPDKEQYRTVLECMIKSLKMQMEYDELCDKQIERQNKFELEKDRLYQEYELKKRELDWRIKMEEKKLKDEVDEAANRRHVEKRQVIWDLIKIGLTTGCTVLIIWFTGKIEQGAILGQHQWSLIPKLFKGWG